MSTFLFVCEPHKPSRHKSVHQKHNEVKSINQTALHFIKIKPTANFTSHTKALYLNACRTHNTLFTTLWWPIINSTLFIVFMLYTNNIDKSTSGLYGSASVSHYSTSFWRPLFNHSRADPLFLLRPPSISVYAAQQSCTRRIYIIYSTDTSIT